MKHKDFTIVICTYNGSENISDVMEAILKLDELDNLVEKIMIVDNKSTDNTKEIIMKYQSKYRLIKYCYEERQGLAFARKHAAYADTDWVIYVDDDNILDKNWLVELKRTIEINPKLGVINGAVIASTKEKLTEKEKNTLNVMYRNLACTHFSYDEISECEDNYIPMGAGMCVRTKSLEQINREGWLLLKGRTGNSLDSGEDTELSNRVFEQGYKYVCNYKMRLKHIIPKSRLTDEYTNKLIIGLTNGRYDFISTKKNYILERSLRGIKYGFIILSDNILKNKYNEGSIEYIKHKCNVLSARTFLIRLKKDYIYRRI